MATQVGLKGLWPEPYLLSFGCLVRHPKEPQGSCAGVGHAVAAKPRLGRARAEVAHSLRPVVLLVGQAAQCLVDAAVALVRNTELLLQLGHAVGHDDRFAARLHLLHDVLAEYGVAVCHYSS